MSSPLSGDELDATAEVPVRPNDSTPRLGSFRLVAKVGAGAMGEVFRGVYEPDGRVFAVKTINAEVMQDSNPRSAATAGRFEREITILKNLRHPNIVRFMTHGKAGGVEYLVMEFIEGIALDQFLEKRGALGWRDATAIGIQLCSALQHAHEMHVIHRDLKPANIMVVTSGSKKGRVVLTDFGIAKALDRTSLTADGRTVGTAPYMAPEQIADTNLISHKTDLYAFGCVMFHLLAGRPPFEGGNMIALMNQHLTAPPPKVGKFAEVPPELEALIDELLAKDASKRPWDAGAVELRLTDIHKNGKIPDAANPLPVASPKKPSRKKETARARKQRLHERIKTIALITTFVAVLGTGVGVVMYWQSIPYKIKQAKKHLVAGDDENARDELDGLLLRPGLAPADQDWARRELSDIWTRFERERLTKRRGGGKAPLFPWSADSEALQGQYKEVLIPKGEGQRYLRREILLWRELAARLDPDGPQTHPEGVEGRDWGAEGFARVAAEEAASLEETATDLSSRLERAFRGGPPPRGDEREIEIKRLRDEIARYYDYDPVRQRLEEELLNPIAPANP